MRIKTGLAMAGLITLCLACEKKDQDAAVAQGQMIASKAQDLAGSAWKSVSEQAQSAFCRLG